MGIRKPLWACEGTAEGLWTDKKKKVLFIIKNNHYYFWFQRTEYTQVAVLT